MARAVALAPCGEVVVLLADDPLAPLDVEAWCLAQGHRLLALAERGGGWAFSVQVAKRDINAETGNQAPRPAV